MNENVRLSHVQSGPALEHIRVLFLEYARGLKFNLCFQNFEKELDELPGPYGLPQGRLVLCEVDETPAGCVALKPLEPGVCEMKRLFVRPQFRRTGLGSKLAYYIISEARAIGYEDSRLYTMWGLVAK